MNPLPHRPRGDLAAKIINVTPMVDVMLVLLIIFMVVTATAPFTATLPRAAQAVPAAEDRVTVGIDDQGRYWVDRTPVAPGALPARLSDAFGRRPGDHVLYLKADDGVEYRLVLDALDAARHAGVRRMSMITQRRDD